MQSIFFWKSWPQSSRRVAYFTGAIFLVALIFMWAGYFQGVDGVVHWEKLQEQKVVETTVHEFRLGPFVLTVPAESYVILEYFNGSDIAPNITASYVSLFILSICAVVLLTVISILEKFWYFFGMALFILFIVSLRFEVLAFAGYVNQVPVIIILAVYVISSFYFNKIKKGTSFNVRLGVFAAITIALIAAIFFLAGVDYPFYHLSLTSYTASLILSVLFIIMVAHEILASFIYATNQGTSKSLQHFSIISTIYMTNVIITCFHELGVFQFNFIYINLYLLLTISAVLGIWGFRQREILYQNILPFSPYGGYFFLALAAICFSTVAQFLNNANDPAVKIIRESIIFSHAGFGFIFLLYIFSNFILMLARNLPAYKVLYSPNRMPYFTYRFAGMIATIAFILYGDWRVFVYHGMAGFYNNAGDLHITLGNRAYAESFYDQGRSQAFQNNRSNYALATMKTSQFEIDDAHYNYELANGKRPTVYSLTNAANLYLWENKNNIAVQHYRRALERIPSSGPLMNNLGFGYAKLHEVDSSLIYLNEARTHNVSKSSAEANFFALATMESLPIKIDSILKLFDTHPSILSNALALSTLHKQTFNTPVEPLQQKTLNLYSATLLNNYIVKYATTLDTTFVNAAYKIASDSLNDDYSEALKSSLAFAFYHRGNVSKALEILAELAYISQSYQGKFNYIMGLWALEQNNPDLAATYFSYSDTHAYKDAKFYNAIALSEAGRKSEALIMWDTVANGRDGAKKEIAARMKKILTMDPQQVLSLSDAEKYQFCRYNIGLRDSTFFNRIINSVESPDYKAQAILDLSKKYYEADLMVPAIRLYNRIAGLELSNKKLYDDVRHAELIMLAYRKEIRSLTSQINKNITFDNARSLEKMLYTALVSTASADTTSAEKNYAVLATYNPYFEEGIIAAADFYRMQGKDNLKPYTILAEALQINATSVRLLKAYIAEAARQGFDEYVASASQRLAALERSLY